MHLVGDLAVLRATIASLFVARRRMRWVALWCALPSSSICFAMAEAPCVYTPTTADNPAGSFADFTRNRRHARAEPAPPPAGTTMVASMSGFWISSATAITLARAALNDLILWSLSGREGSTKNNSLCC